MKYYYRIKYIGSKQISEYPNSNIIYINNIAYYMSNYNSYSLHELVARTRAVKILRKNNKKYTLKQHLKWITYSSINELEKSKIKFQKFDK